MFCHECDLWESTGKILGGNANRNSETYSCKKWHTNSLVPTKLKIDYIPSKLVWEPEFASDVPVQDPDAANDEEYFWPDDLSEIEDEELVSDSDTCDEEEMNHAHLIATLHQKFKAAQDEAKQNPTQEEAKKQGASLHNEVSDFSEGHEQTSTQLDSLQDDFSKLQEQVASQAKKLEASRKTEARLRKQLRQHMPPPELEHATFKDTVKNAIEHAAKKSNLRSELMIGKGIAEAAFEAMNGLAKEQIMKVAKQILRDETYSPFELARLLDMHGGSLNLSNVELMRSLETKGVTYVHGTVLPSASSIQRIFKMVERVGQKKIPFQLQHLEQGEAIFFDEENVLVLLIQAYGLHGIGKLRAIRIAQTLDGANLTKHFTHVMGGLKMNDPSAVCPLTGAPLFVGDFVTAQSRNLCFPWRIHMGKETGLMYDHFSSMFNYMHKANTEGVAGYLPMEVSTETDMSAAWKGLKRGGGAKVHKTPCHCCGTNSDDLAKISGDPCERWCSVHGEGFRCYHKPITTDEALEAMEEEVIELEQFLEATLNKLQQSELTVEDPDSLAGRENALLDPKSIWYRPTSESNRQAYSTLINQELRLRSLPTSGNLSSRRALLKGRLTKEWRLVEIQKEVKACKRSETACFLLMQTIPCILHMENRVGLKLLTMVVLEGLSEAKAGTSMYAQERSEKKRLQMYIAEVERIINRTILGNEDCPGPFRLPYDEQEQKLSPISMENTKVRKVMYGLESLIEASYMTPLKKQQMARSIPKYRQAMEMVRQKEDFTDSDIKAFQKAVDEWFQDYVAVHGLDGMTNYIHMLSTGHVAEYMIKWRNLYRHSQQGWEAFNSLLKTFFFRRTGRGGGRHMRSKLLPIARWLQRRMIWLTGITEEELREACRLLDEDVNVEEEKEQDEEEQKEQDPNEDGDPEQEDLAQLLLSLQQTSGFI
jgi:hypothetical protein